MKKAAIFDMDGLMFDTERIWKDSWNTIVPRYGYEPAPAFPKEVCGTSGEHMLEVSSRGSDEGFSAGKGRASRDC